MSFNDTGLENLLESYTPSDIMKNPSLLLSFRRFFQRGTRLECCELLPEGFGPPSEFPCVDNPLVQRQASNGGATPQSLSPPHACFSQEITEPQSVAHKHSTSTAKLQGPPNSFQLYLETLSISKNRKDRLYRVAQRIAKTKTYGEHHEFRPFEPSGKKDSFTTAKEMYQILVGSSNTTVAISIRVYHVYFADAVDRYEVSLSGSSVGRSMKSLALDKLAEDLEVTRPNVVSMYQMGCKYLACMGTGGPGSLLSIDGAKSDIEKFNDEDFEILFKYRKHMHPNLEERSRSLDFETVQKLVQGLQIQGVENADIARGRTRLVKMICEYIDTRSFLSHGKIVSMKHRRDKECRDMSYICSERSSLSLSPQVQEDTDVNGEKNVSSSLRSREHRIDLHQPSLPEKDSMPVDQNFSNNSVTTNCVNVGEHELSMPLLFATAGKRNLDPKVMEFRLPRNTTKAERYNEMADNPSKRRRLDIDHPDYDVDRRAITSEVVSSPQELREESRDLDVQDFSTDIDEWLQEFGNVDPSNGMDFVVGLLQTW